MNPKSIKAAAFSLALLCLSSCATDAPKTNETTSTPVAETAETSAVDTSVTEGTPESDETISMPEQNPTKTEYALNETWTVEEQWSLTVTDVEEMSERNEYADTKPQAVYRVTFIYENLGYTDPDGFMNGLFFVMDGSIIDSESLWGTLTPMT